MPFGTLPKRLPGKHGERVGIAVLGAQDEVSLHQTPDSGRLNCRAHHSMSMATAKSLHLQLGRGHRGDRADNGELHGGAELFRTSASTG